MKNDAPRSVEPKSPKTIAALAAKMPWKPNARFNVLPYQRAIVALQERGYSYGEIAEWLSKEVGAPIKRGQVYYAYQLKVAEDQESFEKAEREGRVIMSPMLPYGEDEAEKMAVEADKRRRIKKP